MTTTVLFALVVAFLANPPSVRGPGQEAQAAVKQADQQLPDAGLANSLKPEEMAQKNPLAKSGTERRKIPHKD